MNNRPRLRDKALHIMNQSLIKRLRGTMMLRRPLMDQFRQIQQFMEIPGIINERFMKTDLTLQMLSGEVSKAAERAFEMCSLISRPYVVLEDPPYDEMIVPDAVKLAVEAFEKHYKDCAGHNIKLVLGLGDK